MSEIARLRSKIMRLTRMRHSVGEDCLINSKKLRIMIDQEIALTESKLRQLVEFTPAYKRNEDGVIVPA